mmetsp:Transcript_4313/g.6619  ORF Transcript_4313/g.6619 Transcript_4313/m.6619 type:complete len:88 (-) Transcript_4313:262-525(-)|eukprot:CAMPEP_0201722734 /NCGR_PEP_ID=MMETSP0593-20130828/6993_1 /ASSEMBLY_ACC=CAM_ASM_000672 /TAXON_ID=267983 /ORGANISM="Skeletonema japonicum, Strain CCMP2506" /LENGTH=87 /DNA_ID=CAMNT_0048213715 /DNA_START=39 /DNA_END=302 /DNA_ORIENTATION=+
MVFKLLSKIILPNLEKDLARTVTREVSKMELNLAPQVYGYRPKITSAAGGGGAFGTTVAPMMRQQHVQVFQKVDIPFQPNQGLFHEV